MKKYNKSEIMKAAWNSFKSGTKSFAECLHDAWVSAKMLLIGNFWEKYGKRRIYFDDRQVLAMCGVEIEYYKTGNVRTCFVNGEHTSNADGYRWLASVDKYFYDLDTKTFSGSGKYFDQVHATVCAFLGC